MTLKEFKANVFGGTLKFYPSKEEGSGRFVANIDGTRRVITKEDYDHTSTEKHIYPADQETFPGVYWLSNTKQKEAAFEE